MHERTAENGSAMDALKAAVCESNAARVRELLTRYPELQARLNEPLPNYSFGIHALFAAVQRTDRATIDLLLEAGADIQKRTAWWAGGFGVMDECSPELAPFLIERGAVVDAHAASRLGAFDRLREIVEADPVAVHARGGDGQTPLHFASTVAIAEFLLAHGALIDARDVDHESTPAQYMLRVTHKRHYLHERLEVARYLVSKGCQSDILMASALGDAALVRRHLNADPDCIRMSVSDKWFPKQDPRAGGTIYIWTLGANQTAHMVARDFEREDIFQLLMEHTPAELKLALACELGDQTAFDELLGQRPDLVKHLTQEDLQKLPNAAQNNNVEAVKLMLEAGWAVDTRGQMGATALHWAGFNGNAVMTREILRFKPDLELKSREYESTALAWAIFGSGNNGSREAADFTGTVEALLRAQALVPTSPERMEPSAAVLKLLIENRLRA